MNELKQQFDNIWKRLDKLHTRMDDDRDLVNMATFTLKNSKGKDVPYSVSLALNDAALFAANVESSMGAATETCAVESNDAGVDVSYIQETIDGLRRAADVNLAIQNLPPLRSVTNQYMFERGRAAYRSLIQLDTKGAYIERGSLDVDVVNWDPRFMAAGTDRNGLTLAGLQTLMSPEEIKGEYGKEVNDDSEITVIWTREKNEHLRGNETLLSQPNVWGSVPVVYEIVPMGAMGRDKDTAHLYGESGFFMVRDLIPAINELASQIRTLNAKQIEAGRQIPNKGGADLDTSQYKDAEAPGTIIGVENPMVQIPYGRLEQQAFYYHQMIQTRIEKATINSFDMGTFSQPMSAVALLQISQGRDQVFLPRIAAGGRLAESLARMMIKQIQSLNQSQVDVWTRDGRKAFTIDVGKLQGDYSIVYQYFVTNPVLDAARFSLATTAKSIGYPDLLIDRDILQVKDLDEHDKFRRWQEIEFLSPRIKMFRDMARLAGEDVGPGLWVKQESDIMAVELGVTLQQLMRGDVMPAPTAETKPKPMMPIMDNGSARKSVNMQNTPQGGE